MEILTPQQFLIVYNADPKSWAKKHGLEPYHTVCPDCGRSLETKLPFAFRHYRGLITPECLCGSPYRSFCYLEEI